jgi:hypothetical protein
MCNGRVGVDRRMEKRKIAGYIDHDHDRARPA